MHMMNVYVLWVCHAGHVQTYSRGAAAKFCVRLLQTPPHEYCNEVLRRLTDAEEAAYLLGGELGRSCPLREAMTIPNRILGWCDTCLRPSPYQPRWPRCNHRYPNRRNPQFETLYAGNPVPLSGPHAAAIEAAYLVGGFEAAQELWYSLDSPCLIERK